MAETKTAREGERKGRRGRRRRVSDSGRQRPNEGERKEGRQAD